MIGINVHQMENLKKDIYIIAEVGINHNGDMNNVYKLIDIAKETGCDAVKFQKRTIDIVYTKDFLDSERESPWGITQRDQKEGLELTEEDYYSIDEYCKKIEIDWFASAWDIPSQKFLRKFDCKFNKVASAMATHIPFLKEVASEKKLTFLSTGMCEMSQIDRAVEIFSSYNCPLTLMHTVSTYPSNESDLNLNMINTLKEKYELPVGYSGHEVSLSPTLIAAMLGISCIERHITLGRAMYGSDQSASVEYDALKRLVNMVRKIPVVLGDGIKKITDEEKIVAKKLRYFEN